MGRVGRQHGGVAGHCNCKRACQHGQAAQQQVVHRVAWHDEAACVASCEAAGHDEQLAHLLEVKVPAHRRREWGLCWGV